MKITKNGRQFEVPKEITDQFEGHDRYVWGEVFMFIGVLLMCAAFVTLLFSTVKAQEVEFTKDDLGEPINAFVLYPVKMDEPYKTERASYAYHISGGDRDFVKMLNAENGAWTHDSRHDIPYTLCWTWNHWAIGSLPNQSACRNNLVDGDSGYSRFFKTHYDYGFCGMSDGYKKHIVDDPKFLSDWKWQIEQCYKEYKAGTRFYGFDKRYERWSGEFVAYNN